MCSISKIQMLEVVAIVPSRSKLVSYFSEPYGSREKNFLRDRSTENNFVPKILYCTVREPFISTILKGSG